MYFDRLRVKNCWACLIDQRASKLNSYNAVLENKFPDQKREKIAEQMSHKTLQIGPKNPDLIWFQVGISSSELKIGILTVNDTLSKSAAPRIFLS